MKNADNYALLEAKNKQLEEENAMLKKTVKEQGILLIEAKNKQLEEENALLKKTVKEQGILLNWYREQHRIAMLKKYGQSSEKTIAPGQLSLFNEAEATADEPHAGEDDTETETTTVTYKRKKAKGKREEFFKNLPTEQIIHELPEDQRVCPCCESRVHPCGKEVLRREVEVIPMQVKAIEHVQVVYTCRNCEKSAADKSVPMIKSKVPQPVIKGSGVASPSLLAMVMCNKYLLGLPLSRQEKEFGRLGVGISKQTMANWIIHAAKKWLMPIYQLLHKELLKSPENHADETTVQVVDEAGRKASQKSWMWLYCTGKHFPRPVVLFEYQQTRGNEHPKSFLSGFEGYLHADAYAGYRCLVEQGTKLVGCWAHARRKFDEALKATKKEEKPTSLAKKGLDYCNELFGLERSYENLPLDEKQNRRLKEGRKAAGEFFDWCEKSQHQVEHKTAIGKAISYALNQKEYLMNFLLSPKLELSNNRAERAIRPFVVGRKNWLFSYSAKGADASAAVYSIIETALENGLIPFNYLVYLFTNLPNCTSNNLNHLLPWHPDVQSSCKMYPPS